ncbi:hypothetical protein BPORC_1180 [Bifidobacterium porcinum]|nr:hypothetical protein BPORC_1180 [Bifidobacterium porcinum]
MYHRAKPAASECRQPQNSKRNTLTHNGTTIGGAPKPHNIRKLRKHNKNHADNGNCTPRRNVLPTLCPQFAHDFGQTARVAPPIPRSWTRNPFSLATRLLQRITCTQHGTFHESLCAHSETHSPITTANDGGCASARILAYRQDAGIHKDRNVVINRLVTQPFRKITVKSAFRSRSRSAGRVYS